MRVMGAGAGLAISAAVVVGCGAKSELYSEQDGAFSPKPTPTSPPADAGTGTPPADAASCDFEAALTSRPGPCAHLGRECGTHQSIACGECDADADCFEGRCYRRFGAAPTFTPPLMRGLYGSPEGAHCVGTADGALEYVEAALWDDQIDSIVLEISLECEGTLALARTVTLPATAFPDYAGIHGEMRTTTFAVEPPLAVRAGQQVRLMFRAGDPDASYVAYAVSGIHMQDVDPDCHFVSTDYGGIGSGTGATPSQWDYMVRAYVH